MSDPEFPEIRSKVRNSIDEFIKKEYFLLSNDVNERSISHGLAVYLGCQFIGWDVDCEYNRDHDKIKKLNLKKIKSRKIKSDDTNANTVYPDIIIHKRGDSHNNLLVIEIKKSQKERNLRCTKSEIFDCEKLKLYQEDLNYKHALFLRFFTGEKDIRNSDTQNNNAPYEEIWDYEIDSCLKSP
jgi:hypothetical protein